MSERVDEDEKEISDGLSQVLIQISCGNSASVSVKPSLYVEYPCWFDTLSETRLHS